MKRNFLKDIFQKTLVFYYRFVLVIFVAFWLVATPILFLSDTRAVVEYNNYVRSGATILSVYDGKLSTHDVVYDGNLTHVFFSDYNTLVCGDANGLAHAIKNSSDVWTSECISSSLVAPWYYNNGAVVGATYNSFGGNDYMFVIIGYNAFGGDRYYDQYLKVFKKVKTTVQSWDDVSWVIVDSEFVADLGGNWVDVVRVIYTDQGKLVVAWTNGSGYVNVKYGDGILTNTIIDSYYPSTYGSVDLVLRQKPGTTDQFGLLISKTCNNVDYAYFREFNITSGTWGTLHSTGIENYNGICGAGFDYKKSNARPVIVYYRQDTDKLKYSAYNGLTWDAVEVSAAGSRKPSNLIIDNSDNWHVIWSGHLYKYGQPESWSVQSGLYYTLGEYNMNVQNANGYLHAVGTIGTSLVYMTDDIGNTPPTATTPIITVSQDGTGYVNINTAVSDPEANDTKLKIQYESGACSYAGTEATSTISNAVASSDSPTTSTDDYQVQGITTSASNSVTSTWNSKTDLPAGDGSYCVYVTPNDGIIDGTTVSSTVTIDNVAPDQPGSLSVNTTSTDSVILNFGATSTDSNFSEYKIFYSSSTPVTDLNSEINSSTDNNLGDINFNSVTTISIPSLISNTQYYTNIWAYDTFGNLALSSAETVFYTLAPAPIGLATSFLGTSTIDFSVDTFTNHSAGSSGYYFELTEVGVGVASTSGWIQTNTWSIDTLSSSADYSVSVKYRNGDAVETVTSSLEFTTLTDAAPLADVPTGITAAKDTTNNTSQINVFWNTATNASGYRVGYQSSSWTTSPASQSDWTTNLYSYISSLSANTTYYFRVMAKNSDGVETAWSDVASATTDNVASPGGGDGGGEGITLTGTVTINNGLTSTENRDVVVKLVSNVATKYYGPVEATYNADTQQFSVCDFTSASQTAIILTKEFNFTLSSTPGLKRLCLKFDNGNGLTLEKTADITLNVTAESLSSVMINNGEESTYSNTVNLNISSGIAVSYDAFEGVYDEQSKQVTCNLATPTWTDFTTSVEKQITLSDSYGIKAVCVALKKADGSTFYVSDTIEYTQDKKLLLYVPFDEPVGAGDFVDESDFNWNLECLFNCPVSGKDGVKGKAVYLNGKDQQLIIKNSKDLHADNISIIAWVKPESNFNTPSAYQIVAGKSINYELSISDAGIARAGIINKNNTRVVFDSYNAVKMKQWNQIAMTYDGEFVRTYANGKLMGQKAQTGEIKNTLDFMIGQLSSSNNYNYQGLIDELRVYGRVLSDEDIVSNYNELYPDEDFDEKKLLLYLSFDEELGAQKFKDSSEFDWNIDCLLDCPVAGVAGIKGMAVSFNGKNQELIVENATGIYADKNISLLAWVKPKPNVGNQWIYQTVAGRYVNYELTVSDYGVLRTGITNINNERAVFNSFPAVNINRWNQIVVTYDGQFVRAYANGKLVGQKEQTGEVKKTGDLLIGGLTKISYFYQGLLDEFKIYNYTLSPEDIQRDYVAVVQEEYIGPIILDFESGDDSFTDKSGKITTICSSIFYCPTPASGKEGKRGLFFSATSTKRDALTILGTSQFQIQNGITAEGWVKPETANYYDNMAIIAKGGTYKGLSFALFVDSANRRVRAQVKTASGKDIVAFSEVGSVKMLEWSHVAMSYDGFKLKIFLNGKLIIEKIALSVGSAMWNLALVPGAGLADSEQDIVIGSDSDSRNLFKGTIDYVAFYPYVLSDEEIISHFEEEPTLDTDGDGIEDIYDNCPINSNSDQADFDGDGKGNVCDVCPQENIDDKDEDGYCEGTGFLEPMIGDKDNCPVLKNVDQTDIDGDGIGNACDVCPLDSGNDRDKDNLCSNQDNCPLVYNPNQLDTDKDGIGDKCDEIDNLIEPEPEPDCVGEECPPIEPPCIGEGCAPPPEPGLEPGCIGEGCGSPSSEPIGGENIRSFINNIGDNIGSGISKTVKTIVHPIETLKKVSNKIMSTIEKNSPATAKVIRGATRDVQKVIDNPEVERINEKYLAPTIVLAGATNVAVGFQLPIVFNFLRNIFGQPLLLLRRRKQKKWGVIYDSFTKQPVDLATIRVIKDNKVIKTQVSDSQGRYYIILEPGTYQLEVVKPGYLGFSEYLQKVDEDAKYINLYHGEDITIKDENTKLNYNVPLDSSSKKASLKDILRDKTIKVSKFAISITGLSVSGISFIISPNPLISSFFFGHMLFFGITYKLAYAKIPTQFGLITDKQTNKPISNVIVRIFDAEYNKLVNTMTADKKGRYAVLVGPSKYYVTFEKPGYKLAKSDIIDLSSAMTHGMGGMISESVVMEIKSKE